MENSHQPNSPQSLSDKISSEMLSSQLVKMDDEEGYKKVNFVRATYIDDMNDTWESILEEDDETDIYLFSLENEPVGTTRIHYKENNGYKIERVAVVKTARLKNVGKGMMEMIVATWKEMRNTFYNSHGFDTKLIIYLHSQVQVVKFYEKCGFQAVGDIFDEEGILHQKMILVE